MRILLTGATGFIGSHVARTLLAASHDVYAIIRPQADTWRINDVLSQLQVLRGDLLYQEDLRAQLEQARPEVCIHLAWYAEHGKYWSSLENLRLISASLGLMNLLNEVQCKRFIGTGTCVEYDLTQGYFSEETSTLRPSSLYAASKLALYYLSEQIGRQIGMETAWLRLFYLYGPMEEPARLVPHVITCLMEGQVVETTSGEQVRDYLYAADVASGISTVAVSNVQGAVNIASGQPVMVRQLVMEIARVLGREDLIHLGALPLSPSDPPFICGNPMRLRSLGWSPQYTLERGLENTIEWWSERHGG